MPQEKEITIYDIAKQLNISASTVSRGLNNNPTINRNTRKKIHELAKQLGFRSNRFAINLRKKQTNTIGVIVPRLNSYFTSQVLSGMENIATLEGYNLIISQSSESLQKEKANSETMFSSHVDGLLVSLSSETQNIRHFDPFLKKKIPVILFDRIISDEQCLGISIDNFKAGYEATKHLLKKGFRKILHISGNPLNFMYSERIKGYKQALSEYNIMPDAKLIITKILSEESGIEVAEAILKMKHRPDAVFSSNDACAIYCMKTLMQAGLSIPNDIGFVGFNNDPMSKVVEPNLSTINYPGYAMGEAAASQLINHLNKISDIKTTNSIILRSELIIRASSLK
jgi:LacI family transcriptional regulator